MIASSTEIAPGQEPILAGNNDASIAERQIRACAVVQARHVEADPPKRVGIVAARLLNQLLGAIFVGRNGARPILTTTGRGERVSALRASSRLHQETRTMC